MGGRFSRAVAASPKNKTPPKAVESVVKETTPIVQNPNTEFVPFYEPMEERDVEFEKKLSQLGSGVRTVGTVFVPGSDPESAEAKRKQRREQRQKMLKGRVTTARFKQILLEQEALGVDKRELWIHDLAKKYEVDPTLLSHVLSFCRFPKMRKRYDGFLVADIWD